ncbi:Universal stress protein UspA and related nucleotide-binding protein [Methanocella conradii HZ254]|uniref:Universal stress protein UspA and related nucleotide-binding protein n=1 Tax=Methanocella conradii (strain DSM 24694 / JCM 17849 / CGMCC 1.5162 / HZ254) TaxID=1041930 RepID=H8I756_METCZ|nr:Universal stress protein UspA and related nucleotide-binding protein [Methanocella conradii HZ254]
MFISHLSQLTVNPGASVYGKMLIPITRTSNLKFLVDFVNHFLKPGGEITFLHVIASELFTISPAEWRRAMSTISTTHLLSASEGMRVDYRVKKSLSVAAGILDEATSGGYDLILMANSTYRKHLKYIFGSNVDEVIRKARVEVIAFRYMDDREMRYNRILIPTSGHQHSVSAARLAEQLYRQHGSDITVLYVGDSNEEAIKALKPVSESLTAMGIKHRALHRRGPVVETILDEADKGYDLMMIGATERPLYYQFLLGSTADRLVKKAPCPILMVKSASTQQ